MPLHMKILYSGITASMMFCFSKMVNDFLCVFINVEYSGTRKSTKTKLALSLCQNGQIKQMQFNYLGCIKKLNEESYYIEKS